MFKLGVIDPSQSEWASPVVLIPKPDGSPRFCIDCRQLNERTVRDSYPLPRMDDCLDSLGDAQFFFTLNCNAVYWQISKQKRISPRRLSPATVGRTSVPVFPLDCAMPLLLSSGLFTFSYPESSGRMCSST